MRLRAERNNLDLTLDEGRVQRASDLPIPSSHGITAQSASPLLMVRDFRTWFKTDRGIVRAVDGVSFSVSPGETLGIVGESGSGKTVLSRSLMNLISGDNVVRSGEVLLRGRNLLDLDFREMRKVLGAEIAMVFQDPMTSLNPVMRIQGQLTEGIRLHQKLSKGAAREKAIALLRAVHLPTPERILRQYPHQLSGGMRQRVMIAIAISCGPQLLLADEPTTALDVTVQAQILDVLEEKQRESSMATVLISHDLGVVATRTDRVAVMYAGKIVEIGPTPAIFNETRMPYTEVLLKSIPRLDDSSRGPLQAISGRPPDPAALPSGCRFAPRCPYAQDRCRAEEPPLREATTVGHSFACWYPVGAAKGTSAVKQNIERGVGFGAADTASATPSDPS
jgi:peptide/nickel transport system ATP-binding protein